MKSIILSAVIFLAACGGGGDAPPVTCRSTAVLALLGDSTMANPIATQQMHLAMDAAFPGRVRVVNYAVPGSYARDAQSQMGPFDIAIDNHGINDECYATDPDVYLATMKKLAERVIIETSNPITACVNDYAALVRPLAGIDTNAFVVGVTAWATHLPDGIHPDEELATLIAKNRAQAMLPRVRSLLCGG